jgi:predicted dienelactone hydrolase
MTPAVIAFCLFSQPAPGLEVRLPAPAGPFAVGRVAYHWTDPSRPEPLSAQKGAHREVMVYVWYPADTSQNASQTAPYLPDFPAAQKEVREADLRDMFRPASYSTLEKSGLPHTHTVENARMPSSAAKYPLLVFSHGWGNPTLLYTAELEDLASHGYVVAAIEHPYDTTFTIFPGGRIVLFAQEKYDTEVKKPHGYIDYAFARVEVMAADTRFVLDQLTRYDKMPSLHAPFAGHLDLRRIGAFGHSIGGMASARAAQIDNRIRACIDQDSIDDRGSPFTVFAPGKSPLEPPFLLFIGPSSDIFSARALHPSDTDLAAQKLTRAAYDAIIQKQQKQQNELLASVRGGSYRVLLVDIPGFTHRSFSDLPLLAADDTAKMTESLRNFRLAQAYTRAFFDRYLKDRKETLLDLSAGDSSDSSVKVERFGPASK